MFGRWRLVTPLDNLKAVDVFSFHEPVPAIEPTGRLRNPAATVTVDDVHGLAMRVQAFARAFA